MRASLVGLAVGDAFGQTMARPGAAKRITKRLLPIERPWRWTDDTAMAISIVENIERFGAIDQDELVKSFVERWRREPDRAYGLGATMLLERVAAGGSWREEAQRLFDGRGSYGNGAAMRVAPIGAFFAGSRSRTQRGDRSEDTHAHPTVRRVRSRSRSPRRWRRAHRRAPSCSTWRSR
jgi:ADP-ribosylglycohydrolase